MQNNLGYCNVIDLLFFDIIIAKETKTLYCVSNYIKSCGINLTDIIKNLNYLEDNLRLLNNNYLPIFSKIFYYEEEVMIWMTISLDCKKSDHMSCTRSFGNNSSEKCECRCHLSKNTPESLQEEKDKRGITIQDELRAETLP
jgi:hypothetical protein